MMANRAKTLIARQNDARKRRGCKQRNTMRKLPALLAVAIFISGCGGGGSGSSAVPSTPARSAAVGTKTIQIIVPAPAKTASRVSHYVSSNTLGIGVSLGASPFTFPPSTTPTAAFDISGSSTLCTTGSSGRVCTVIVTSPFGNVDFQLTAWDCVPTGGNFTGCKSLSTVTALNQAIASGVTAPTLNLTLSGVVSSVAFSISPATLPAGPTVANGGTLQTATLSANVLDTDGNIIMGSGNYIDSSGNTLTIGLTQSALASGGSTATTLSATTFTPAVPTVTVTYSGGSTWGTVFTPTVTGGTLAGTTTGATLNVTPTVTLFPIPSGSSAPWRITGSTDGNLYFTESASQQIARINAATGAFTEISDSGASGEQPSGITQASDGNIWAVMYNPGFVANYFSVPTGANFSAANIGSSTFGAKFLSMNPYGDQQDIVDGGDGCMYASEPGAADIYGFSLTTTICPTGTFPGSNTPVGLVKGPDGNIWYADSSGTVGYFSIPGHVITQMAATGGANPSYLTVGSDGHIWFTVPNGSYVQNVSTSGTLSAQYPMPSSIGGLGGIVSGSDGALWVAGGAGGIARVTTSGVVTTYSQGLGPTDDPFAMATGPDGNIWFTETNANKIGRLIY